MRVEMAVAVRDLEAAAVDDDGAVALPLRAVVSAREGEPQRVAVGARPRDGGPGEKARERGLADLGVDLAVVLVLDPGLRRLVQERPGQVGHMLQHGDQPALDRPPERLLLGILVRAIRERRLVQDAEPGQPSRDLGGGHGGAVVAQRRTRQAALLERLAQAMGDDLGALGQIPLQMAGEARAVVEHAEQDRREPLAARRQHLPGAVVAVPVPEAVDILGLVAANLAIIEARLGALGAVRSAWRDAPPLVETVGLEEPAQRRVGRHGLEIGLGRGQRDEIVVMQLDAPALVRGILRKHGLAHGVAHRHLLTGIGTQLAPQHADRIGALCKAR